MGKILMSLILAVILSSCSGSEVPKGNGNGADLFSIGSEFRSEILSLNRESVQTCLPKLLNIVAIVSERANSALAVESFDDQFSIEIDEQCLISEKIHEGTRYE